MRRCSRVHLLRECACLHVKGVGRMTLDARRVVVSLLCRLITPGVATIEKQGNASSFSTWRRQF
jgi:hypothetical protein